MNTESQLERIHKRTRRRFTFTAVALFFYFSFAFVWTDAGAALSNPIGDGAMNWALLMFISLIIIFVSMEFVFLRISAKEIEDEAASQRKEGAS